MKGHQPKTIDIVEKRHPLSYLPIFHSKAITLKMDPNNFEVITDQHGKYTHVFCKSCGVNGQWSEKEFVDHWNEKHKVSLNLPLLDKFITEQAKKLADTPKFFESYKDDPRVQRVVNQRAKRMIEDPEFISAREKEHPEWFEPLAKKRAEGLIFHYIKTLEENEK